MNGKKEGGICGYSSVESKVAISYFRMSHCTILVGFASALITLLMCFVRANNNNKHYRQQQQTTATMIARAITKLKMVIITIATFSKQQ